MLGKIKELIIVTLGGIIVLLPNMTIFNRCRAWFYRRRGCVLHADVSITTGVIIKGRFEMKRGSSIAQNCIISGENAGVFIGEDVMIAPNCVFVAFDHVFERVDIPMAKQGITEAAIVIEDDVWIAANCTITKGITIGKGSIIAANSVVTKDVLPYSIVGGVPAKLIRSRLNL
jgi:serine acetyltransferase